MSGRVKSGIFLARANMESNCTSFTSKQENLLLLLTWRWRRRPLLPEVTRHGGGGVGADAVGAGAAVGAAAAVLGAAQGGHGRLLGESRPWVGSSQDFFFTFFGGGGRGEFFLWHLPPQNHRMSQK